MRQLLTFALVLACSFVTVGCADWEKQIKEEERRRVQWNTNCLKLGGEIVYNGKGSPSKLCFDKEGRLRHPFVN